MLIGLVIDILLLFRIMIKCLFKWFVLFMVLKVMLVFIELLLIMVIVLLMFLGVVLFKLWVMVKFSVVEIDVEECFVLKVLYGFLFCLVKLDSLFLVCRV